jgi:hypothetical protein
MDDNNILAAIDKANPMRARSPLARWMLQNHDAFAARYTARRGDWTALAKVFVDAGLTDADGNPPNSVTARKTWQRVRQMVRSRQMQKQGPFAEPPETHRLPVQPTLLPPQTADAAPLVEYPQKLPPRRFGTATPRGHTPSALAPPRAAIPAPEPDPDRADRVIAELLAAKVTGRFAPKIDDGE